MKTVEHFVLGYDGEQKAIISYLHHLLTVEHDLIPKIRYNIPFYYRKSWICYINPLKNNGVELAFLKGHLLSNEHGLLDQKDRKIVSGISYFQVSDILDKDLNPIVQEAIILDEMG